MGKQYVVRKATHVGRSHLIDFVNRQDSHALFDGEINGRRCVIGIICDGCSEGTSSEVGATLASNFLIRGAVRLLQEGASAYIIPNILYLELLDFLRRTVDGYPFKNQADRVSFIKDHLLFTVVGFIVRDEVAIVFITGDGMVIINTYAEFVDANNRPSYPAYHLVDRSVLERNASALPDNFDIRAYNIYDIYRLAIGSDAWKDESDLIHENIWGFKNPAGLQRRVNQWSKTDKRFKDDVTLITVEIVNSESPEGDSNAGSN